jgi:hypothetical protein
VEKIIVDALSDDVSVTTSIKVELIIIFALIDDTLMVDAVIFDAAMLFADIVLPVTVE